MHAAILALALLGADNTVTEADFNRLHFQLQPDPNEAWRSIPWQISLLEAREDAAQQKKPIFIWAMDGHPLGCT